MANQRYIPALAYQPLTAVYDPVVRLTTRESVFKPALLHQADLQPGDQVLDLGCGTATLTIAAKQLQSAAELTGLDGDPEILRRAKDKTARAGVNIGFDEALSHCMPYADATFDVVVSSLFFHHLNRDSKMATLREVRRVLKPGGMLHIADWGKAANPLMRGLFLGIQLLDGFDTTADNVAGYLPEFMRDSGFTEVEETHRFATMFGTLSLYRGLRSTDRTTGMLDSGL